MKLNKIGVIGNLVNVGQNISFNLNRIGIDTKLILHEHEIPTWKFFNQNKNPNLEPTLEIIPKKAFDNKFLRRFSEISHLNKFDVIISVALGGMWSLPFVRKPFVSYATGSDLRELAAGIGYTGLEVSQARRVFKKAKLVFFSPDQGHIEMIKKLKLKNVIPWKQFVDTEFWKPVNSESYKESKHLTIFHPTALNWVPKTEGQSLKSNNLLFEGFRSFLDSGGSGKLYFLKRGQNVSETEELIEKLDLKKFCESVGENLEPVQLKSKMINADIIVDQFHPGGGFGLITLEAMSLGKPTMVGITDEMMKLAYPNNDFPPILQAFSKEQIAKKFMAMQDSKIREQIGLRSREWILTHHGSQKLAYWYLEKIQEALSKINI